ncbi:MAG: hypothetical protein C5B49_16445 [Bdellovibrio sp.]|nr:MAG: hypothetical protein C5B49_16445 [Bdellovibrio sp.]
MQLATLVNNDLNQLPYTDRRYYRYFSIVPWENLGTLPTPVTADWQRAAIIKMVNFLSTGPSIVQPTPIDTGRFIYRVDMRQLKWTSAAWNNIKNTDPYLVPANFPTNLANAAQQTVRADWFVTNIPNSAVNAYFIFLGINSDDPTIDHMNGVDRFGDMAKGYPATVREGVMVSNTEAHNRILSWHATTGLGSGPAGTGHLFKSYNFDSDTGTSDIFSHPYEPMENNPDPNGQFNFEFADSDNIFSLPNGLNGYYTTIGDPATPGVVQTAANAGAFPGPTFCFQCHDTVTNMIVFQDNIHDALLAEPFSVFPANVKNLLVGMYNQEGFQAEQAAAGARFAKAYAQLNLPVAERVGMYTESSNVVNNHYSVSLTTYQAAAELGTTVADLIAKIKSSSRMALALGSLLPVDSNGNPIGGVRRDLWEANYVAVRALVFPGTFH